MVKSKNNRKNKVFPVIILIAILLISGFIFITEIYTLNKIKFKDEDYEYMYSYIEEKFGNGEKFNVVKTQTDTIKVFDRYRTYSSDTVIEEYNTKGIKANVIGYFDSQEKMYSVNFIKLLKDSLIYKNGKAGEIICTSVVNSYTKQQYFGNSN